MNGFWAFFRSYVLSRRFVHGYDGFFISVLIAMETFLKYAKLYERKTIRRGAADSAFWSGTQQVGRVVVLSLKPFRKEE